MLFDLNKIKEFSVSIYGNLEPLNEVTSKARVRIFYKGYNRNGSYITDEFADSLIESLPYSPVKGIFNEEDFTDHGEQRTEGRAYGVVMGPNEMDFAWENHLDDDGVERTYACANVLLWTGLYKEAKDIPGKSQSMELYEPSIEGELVFKEGKRCFKFTKAKFLGLQVLGDNTEPCFEGSAFYTLYTSMKELVDQMKDYTLVEDGGKNDMPMDINYFKLSDNQKFEGIFALLNPNFNEEGNWDLDYNIVDVYEKYALCYNRKKGCYEQVDYVKDDATDSIELGEHRTCYIMDVTEGEKAALEMLHERNNSTYENVNENFVEVTEFNNAKADYEQKIEEANASINTLTVERDEFATNYTNANEQIQALKNQCEELASFKKQIETNDKNSVIDRYADLLDEAVISSYTSHIDEYTIDALEKELAFELVKKNPTVFTKPVQTLKVPKDEPRDGIEEILSKYKK